MAKPFLRRFTWDIVVVVAIAGLIYGIVEFYNYAGPWKTLVVAPLMAIVGYLAVEICYPMWFGPDR
jgi:hypothetical protein